MWPRRDAGVAPEQRWLFPGRIDRHPTTARQFGRLFKEAAKAAGLRKAVSLHSLRHSVAQKIVSKAEGRMIDLATIEPSAKARTLAAEVDKDPRLVELILSESIRVVRARRNVLIVEHKLGFIIANAGVDQSNVGPADGSSRALLLPENPDRSAETLRDGLAAATGSDLAVVINDSFGRPWRQGTAGVAIGVAGLPGLIDLRGRPDLFGRKLEAKHHRFRG